MLHFVQVANNSLFSSRAPRFGFVLSLLCGVGHKDVFASTFRKKAPQTVTSTPRRRTVGCIVEYFVRHKISTELK
jgi:hypothetical protein